MNFLLANTTRKSSLLHSCSKTAPTAWSDASVRKMKFFVMSGSRSMGQFIKWPFRVQKLFVENPPHSTLFGLPFSVRSVNEAAIVA